ncbi:MAG TPA: hypothetical protein VM865_02715 [Acidobacteriaceae bacterium]|jgi:multidrug resistance efflux pump|nr:hypothetical protein [Acidobacteriaceae bacterium]
MSRLHNDLEIAQLEVRDAKLQQEIQRRQHRQVDARPLETARAHVRDAEANLRAAQSNLRAALDGHIKGCEQVL